MTTSSTSCPTNRSPRMRVFATAATLFIITLTTSVSLTEGGEFQKKNQQKVVKKEVTKKTVQKNRVGTPFEIIVDDPSLPRVLLIGDSISIGYTVSTRKSLAQKANVHRIPENGGPTSSGLSKFDKWLGSERWDVIHFNWGLHDLKYIEPNKPGQGDQQVPPEQYEKNLRQLVTQLKQHSRILIFATTTPYPDGVSPIRVPDDAVKYNDIAKRIMKENDVIVNDLYTFILPQLSKTQRPKNVHFTAEGSNILGKQVAKAIQTALDKQ